MCRPPGNHLTVAVWDSLYLRGSVLISDGGLATELEARGHDLSDPLWSANCWRMLRRRSSRCTPHTFAPVP